MLVAVSLHPVSLALNLVKAGKKHILPLFRYKEHGTIGPALEVVGLLDLSAGLPELNLSQQYTSFIVPIQCIFLFYLSIFVAFNSFMF